MRILVIKLIMVLSFFGAQAQSTKYAIVRVDGKWGAINEQGEFFIKPDYLLLYTPAVVYAPNYNASKSMLYPCADSVFKYKRSGKYGFLNLAGEEIIANKYAEASDFKNGFAIVSEGIKQGLINKDGDYVIPYGKYEVVEFDSEFVLVKKGKRYGIFNTKGELIIPVEYKALGLFNSGLAKAKMDKLFGYLNKNNEWVIDAKYKKAKNFQGSYAPVETESGWGLMDLNENFILAPKFEMITESTEGMYWVEDKAWTYADTLGNVSTELFDKVYHFNEGMAIGRRGVRVSMVNKEFEIVLPFDFDVMKECSDNILLARKHGRWFYFTKTGEPLNSESYIKASPFSDGLAKVMINNKFGYINTKGELTLPATFIDAKDFYFGYARALVNGNWIFIDKSGQKAIDLEFEHGSDFYEIK